MTEINYVQTLIIKVWAIVVGLITSGGVIMIGIMFYITMKGDVKDSNKKNSFWK